MTAGGMCSRISTSSSPGTASLDTVVWPVILATPRTKMVVVPPRKTTR
jgi:hypothetical protein